MSNKKTTESVLAQEFNVPAILKFTFPTIFMMVFMGLYTITDTIFVSSLAVTDALAAMNIVCPAVNLMVGLGTMLAAGGNAAISRKMGEGKLKEAREDLSILLLFFPAGMIQTLFANLFVTAGNPGLGAAVSVCAGLANIVLDYFFMKICRLGIRGAALGTGCGYLIPVNW